MCSGGSAQAHHPCGLPHSEIPGSTLDCNSPRRIVAYHVLHRPSAPRHPPRALCSLITNVFSSALLLFSTCLYMRLCVTLCAYVPTEPLAGILDGTQRATLHVRSHNSTQYTVCSCQSAALSNSSKASLWSTPQNADRPVWQPLDYHKPLTLSRNSCLLRFAVLIACIRQSVIGTPEHSLVEASGFEPLTYCVQSSRSPN